MTLFGRLLAAEICRQSAKAVKYVKQISGKCLKIRPMASYPHVEIQI
jgi:hypothetical protein